MTYPKISAKYEAPPLDRGFLPFDVWMDAFLEQAERPISVAIRRGEGEVSVFRTRLRGKEEKAANRQFLERFIKFALWSVGGWQICLCGCEDEAEDIRAAYAAGGVRQFDADFMAQVYDRPFEVVSGSEEDFPLACENPMAVGGYLSGCRIGFDAGGSDYKVSAVIDGKTVFSQETVWHPKLSDDPQYHYERIVSALQTAASHLPRVDGIGVSSAGVIVRNRPMVSSLFRRVPPERMNEVQTIYERAVHALGENIPLVVANDGDVTALAGAMSLQRGGVMGIAMGTSQAAGYVNRSGQLPGWLSELAFAPVDLQQDAPLDEWSGDRGVGGQYFSQDAVMRLAASAGITLPETLFPAEKLKAVQDLAQQGDRRAKAIFDTMGVYLAHAVRLYQRFYPIDHLLLLGRVMSGQGGQWLLESCRRELQRYDPLAAQQVELLLPEESVRRVGQATAAASLPGSKEQTAAQNGEKS